MGWSLSGHVNDSACDRRGSRTEFTHDEAGRQVTRQLPLGVEAENSSFTETKVYDKTANLTVDVDGDGTNDSDPGYGQLLHEIDFEGRVTQYLYDNSASGRGRLVARRYFESESAFNGGAGTPQRVISYRYDALGRQALTRPPPDPLRLARVAAREGRGPSQRFWHLCPEGGRGVEYA